MQKLYAALFIVFLVLFVTIVELVRKRQLREKYSILWLVVAFSLIVAFFNEPLINTLSHYLGIQYPPSLLFLGAIFGLIMLSLMLSVIDSHQTDRIIKLTQKVALLEEKVNELSNKKREKLLSNKENSKNHN